MFMFTPLSYHFQLLRNGFTERGIKPDLASFNMVLDALANAKQLSKAIGLLHEMRPSMILRYFQWNWCLHSHCSGFKARRVDLPIHDQKLC